MAMLVAVARTLFPVFGSALAAPAHVPWAQAGADASSWSDTRAAALAVVVLIRSFGTRGHPPG
jgi:hypothetical protein